jgi:hypothetical protein
LRVDTNDVNVAPRTMKVAATANVQQLAIFDAQFRRPWHGYGFTAIRPV